MQTQAPTPDDLGFVPDGGGEHADLGFVPQDEKQPKIGEDVAMLGTHPVDLKSMRATIRGALDMVPFSHKFVAATQGEPVEAVDQRYEAEKAAHPIAFRGGQVAGAMAMPVKSIPGMAALGAASTAGDSRGDWKQMLSDAGLGGVVGGAVGGLANGAGRIASKIAGGALPFLSRLEAKFATQVGDAGVKEAEKTANSAFGSYRSSRTDANRILELLQKPSGDATVDSASKMLLESPQGQALQREVKVAALERAPEALDNIDALRALADEAHAAIPQARAAATSDAGLRDALAQRTKDQIGRYAIPAVGAAAGAAIGGPVGMGIGAAAGRGISPGVRAVVLNNVLAPERKLLMTRSAVSTAQKLAGMAASQPQVLGKFAAPLARAFERGPDAVSATHLILAQDPDYQQLLHQAEGE